MLAISTRSSFRNFRLPGDRDGFGEKLKPPICVARRCRVYSSRFAQHDIVSRLLNTHQEVIHLAYATVPTLGTVYGKADDMPIRETHQTKPISPHGISKTTLETMPTCMSQHTDLNLYACVSLTHSVGQKPFFEQDFIATAITSAMKGIPIKIFGQCKTIREYIYVSDLASKIESSLKRGYLSETYNISSGARLSNTGAIRAVTPMTEEFECEVSVEYLPGRAFDVEVNVVPDSTKLHEHTGWRQRVKFSDGLQRTYKWSRALEK